MSKQPPNFRKTDMMRAIAAVRTAGFPIARVEVDATGRIAVIPGEPVANTSIDDRNPWDTVGVNT
jgi:hypothetical protein